MKIAIVDDDPYMHEWLKPYLNKAGFELVNYQSPLNLRPGLEEERPDLILLDIMMPGMSGYELLEYEKIQKIAPVIFMSAKGASEDIVKGLKLGGDDYLVKPFDIEELLARISVVLRRANPKAHCIYAENLQVNTETYEVIYENEKIHLPQKEFALLVYLMENKNRVFTREQIFDALWGIDKESDLRTVDVHIKRLRARFKGDHSWSIKTVWGVGYKFLERKSHEVIKT